MLVTIGALRGNEFLAFSLAHTHGSSANNLAICHRNWMP